MRSKAGVVPTALSNLHKDGNDFSHELWIFIYSFVPIPKPQ